MIDTLLIDLMRNQKRHRSPSSFAGPLYFIMNERDKVIQDYFALFEEHLAPYFVTAVPEVIEFMKSDMALRVFEPEVWKGIERFPPLELKFKDTVLKATFMFRQPTLIRKRSLGVPTNVSVHVRSERFSHSFPFVVAPKATEQFVRLCSDYRQIDINVERAHYTMYATCPIYAG